MEDRAHANSVTPRREPWNKGKLIGTKPPLLPRYGWSMRTMPLCKRGDELEQK